MPHFTEDQQARLRALPTAILMVVLVMGGDDPVNALQDMIDRMDFILEVKQAYPDNALIQGIFEDSEIPPRVLHLSSLSDKEAVWRELRLYIEGVSALLGVDTEIREFRAFLVGLAEKLAEDAGVGMFGSDPLIEEAQREYLRTLELQFSLVPSNPIDDTLL
jgi:hypothetical protein